MVWLANFASKGVSQASLSTTFTLLMSLIFPPLFWINGALISFLFLTKSIQDFIKIVLIVILVTFVVLEIQLQSGIIVFGLIILWLPILFGTFFIKKYQSLSIGIEYTAIGFLLIVTVVLALAGDMEAYWSDIISQVFPADKLDGDEQQTLQALMQKHASNMTGWLAAGMLLGSVGSMLIARHWHKKTVLKETFAKEFLDIKYSQALTVIGLVIFIASFFIPGLFLDNLSPIVIIAFVFIGVAIVHSLIIIKTSHISWLVLFYFLLVLMFPNLSVVLAAAGMTDYWLQYRKRMS